jgi:hypothetical protein
MLEKEEKWMLLRGESGEKGIFASLLGFSSLQLSRGLGGDKLVAAVSVFVSDAQQEEGVENAEEAEEKLGEVPGESLVLASLPLFPLSATRSRAKSEK